MEDFAFILAGFVVGFIVGLTGVGGGSLMTPLLIFGFGIKPALAVGTDLLFAAGTKAGGMLNFARQRIIPWRVVFSLSLGSVPAALLTLWVLHDLGASNPVVQKAITFTLGIALMLTAAATLYKAIRGPRRVEVNDTSEPERPADQTKHPLLPIFFGAVIGVLVTLSSVGAGHRFDAALPPTAAVPHCGGRHCLRRASHLGGRLGPCVIRYCGLVFVGFVAVRLFARHLAGLALGHPRS